MTHDEAVKTIREALRVAAMWIPDDSSGDTKTLFKSIAALDLLAKTSKQESSEDTREFAQEVFSAIEDVYKVDGYKKAAALITARDERIRRECDTSVQKTLTACGVHEDAGIRKAISAAIMGGKE